MPNLPPKNMVDTSTQMSAPSTPRKKDDTFEKSVLRNNECTTNHEINDISDHHSLNRSLMAPSRSMTLGASAGRFAAEQMVSKQTEPYQIAFNENDDQREIVEDDDVDPIEDLDELIVSSKSFKFV